MAARSARINSPEVITQFRAAFVDFTQECQKEIEGIRNDMQRTIHWLQADQMAYWRSQLIKREELAEEAKRAYSRVAYTTGPLKKEHVEDERIAMIKARRRKEEAEEKIKTLKSWIIRLNQEGKKELKSCDIVSSRLATLGPKALGRLDQMINNLDAYIRPESGSSQPKGKI